MTIDDLLDVVITAIEGAGVFNTVIKSPPNLSARKLDHISLPALFIWDSGSEALIESQPGVRAYEISVFITTRNRIDNTSSAAYEELRGYEKTIDDLIFKLDQVDGVDFSFLFSDQLAYLTLPDSESYLTRETRYKASNVEG